MKIYEILHIKKSIFNKKINETTNYVKEDR